MGQLRSVELVYKCDRLVIGDQDNRYLYFSAVYDSSYIIECFKFDFGVCHTQWLTINLKYEVNHFDVRIKCSNTFF